MQNKQDFMKTKPVFPLLLSMAAPMVLSMLIQSLYNIVDSIFVARLGTEALTAVSLVYPLQNIVLSLSVGVGVGINSVIARKLGEQKPEEANKAASIGMGLTFIHCILIIIFGLLVTKPFLSIFTSDPQTLAWACRYSYIVLCFSAGSLIHICFEKIFQSVGAMLLTMISLLVGCITNIILDPILIFGLFGLPAMGVTGAAVATVTGQFCSLFVYLIIYGRKDIGIKISPKYFSFDKSTILQIYSVGIPSSLMLAAPSLMSGILNFMLAGFSDIYVAILGIYLKLQTFLYTPASGIVQALRPIAGYNYGAGEKERLHKIIRCSMLLVVAIMTAGTLAALVFPQQIFAVFIDDPALIGPGSTALRIISLGFIVSTVSVVYAGLFEALGCGKKSLLISLIRQIVIIIPLGFILSRIWGPVGIWVCFPIAEFLAAGMARIMVKKQNFENHLILQILQPASDPQDGIGVLLSQELFHLFLHLLPDDRRCIQGVPAFLRQGEGLSMAFCPFDQTVRLERFDIPDHRTPIQPHLLGPVRDVCLSESR